jgi:predicted glycosyltransferase
MKVAILHYSVAPVVGGVEAVIQAHAALFVEAGFQVTLIAGVGEQDALPAGVELIRIPAIRISFRPARRLRQVKYPMILNS